MKHALKDMFLLRELILLDLHQDRDGKLSLSVSELIRSGNKIKVSKKHADLKNITHFAKQYSTGMPVAINLSGKGILQKEIDGNKLSAIEAFNIALPNSNSSEFYIQWAPNEVQTITMVRREAANLVFNELSRERHVVVSLSLNLEESMLKKQGIALLLGLEKVGVEQPILTWNLEQLLAKAKLKGIGLLSAMVMFTLLFVNFACYVSYSNKVAMLEQQHNVSQDKVGKYQMIEADVKERIGLITSIGWTGGHNLAWLTDRLMASKPLSIGMSEFVINPIKKRSSEEQPIAFENLKILIRGNSEEAVELNNWLHEIRAMDWVKDCELVSYNYNKESGKGEFMLALNIAGAEQ
jgi:hypothetical protein